MTDAGFPAPDAGQQPETSPAEPQATESTSELVADYRAEYNHAAIDAATVAHATAVSEAHATLRSRMETAYQVFADELDRAWTVWENAVTAAKSSAATATEVAHDNPGGSSDPTTAS